MSALLERAMALHRAGRLTEAEAAYESALRAAPKDGAALHAFGVLRHQQGDSAAAVKLYEKAMARGLVTAECLFNLGLAQFRLGAHAEAEQAFRRAARKKPDWPQPLYDLGNALAAQRKFDAACRAYRAALLLRPDYVQAAVNLANCLRDAGRAAEAIAAYRAALARHPDAVEAHNNLGAALLAQNDLAGAEAACRAALALRPDFPDALLNLGLALDRAGRHEAAAKALRRAETLAPADPGVLAALFAALRHAQDFATARGVGEALCALLPEEAYHRFNLAETCRRLHEYEAAAAHIGLILARAPDHPEAHNDLANILRAQGRFAEADAHYRAAIAGRETATHLVNYWALLRDQMRLDEARAVLDRAAALPGAMDDAKHRAAIENSRALTDFTAGDLQAAFARFEARRVDFGIPDLAGPEWRGGDPAGQAILVAAEQGLGDTVHFLRYVPALAARGARVMLRVPPALARLAASLPCAVSLAPDDTVPEGMSWCHVMSLPFLLGLHEACPVMPYLAADPDLAAAWRARLAKLPGLRVGLVWAGNTSYAQDRLRSVPPARLAPLAAVPGVRFVSLQKDAAALPDFPIADHTAALADMADTAALIAALDLVIGVDTGVIHVAGALGAPVWMLNRADADYRWGAREGASAWYPSLREFRQAAPRDWDGVMARVAAALAARARA